MGIRKVFRSTGLLGSGLIVLVLLLASFSGMVGAQPISVDGNPADWTDPTWRAVLDPVNEVTVSGGIPPNDHPHDNPYFARSGYDMAGMWVHFSAPNWYLRLDTDGLPGDGDSQTGTAGNPGVGTTTYDSGPLASVDGPGVSPGEEYTLWFRFQSSGPYVFGGTLRGGTGANPLFLLPGTAYSLRDEVATWVQWGSGAYGTGSNTGTIEFQCPVANLFPAGTCRDQFWVGAHIGTSADLVSEDEFNPILVQILGFGLSRSHTPISPTPGQTVDIYLDGSITNDAGLLNPVPATNLTVVEVLDSDLTYTPGSCSGGPVGTTCSYNGGTRELTWTFPASTPPGSGQLQYQATYGGGDVQNTATMTSDEGLCDQASDAWTPTSVGLVSFTAQSTSGAISLDWETAMETDNIGFHLYRSESPEGARIRLNSELIPSQFPGGPAGAHYRFLDESATRGIAYDYWLETLDAHGGVSQHGPASALLPLAQPEELRPFRVLLPAIGR